MVVLGINLRARNGSMVPKGESRWLRVKDEAPTEGRLPYAELSGQATPHASLRLFASSYHRVGDLITTAIWQVDVASTQPRCQLLCLTPRHKAPLGVDDHCANPGSA